MNLNYHEIRAVYNEHTIRVYQAYCSVIAEEAVRLGTFGSHFKLSRMTWIKPSFLWMMYRSGWATKPNQEHILAIDIQRETFDTFVRNAVISSYHDNEEISFAEWQKQIQTSDVRVQWDPERDIFGNALPYRSIQIGIRGEMLSHFVQHSITQIQDITEFVTELRTKKEAGENILPLLPEERKYVL